MIIATICARGGSVGVPRKNIRPLLGKPLIAYSIEHALACPVIERVFVSTDDPEIADIAAKSGATVPFLRPADLATSTAPKVPVIRHLVEWVEAHEGPVSTIVDLDPTSPLRDVQDIQDCLALAGDSVDVVITAYEAEKNPYFNMVERDETGAVRLVKPLAGGVTSRQQAPVVYAMNASIYVWKRAALNRGLWDGRIALHVMPRERSIDIDSEIDFQLVELLMKKRHAV
jgi:CMP-N,N'-diacetyllegionaminic acid synthase